jgi:hypothetical protein
LLEVGDGKPRRPLAGGRAVDPRILLPSTERLLEIDRVAEAAACGVAGPQLRQQSLFVVDADLDTNGQARAADGRRRQGVGPGTGPPGLRDAHRGTNPLPYFHTNDL